MQNQSQTDHPKGLLRVKSARMYDWIAISVALWFLVWLMAPQQLPVSVYKLSLVAMAAVAGY